MAKTRDILVHVSVEIAVRGRKCHHSSKHSIQPNEKHLAIRNDGGLGSKNYCRECAAPILAAATEKLSIVVRELDVLSGR